MNIIENSEKLNKEIKPIYTRNKNGSLFKNDSYKKENLRINKNKKYSMDNIIEYENDNNDLPENNKKNYVIRIRTCLKKDFDNNLENNNQSFDDKKNELFDKNLEESKSPPNKIIQMYNKYGNKNYSTNRNKKKETSEIEYLNSIISKNNSKEKKNINNYSKKIYENQIDEMNNKIPKTWKIKSLKIEKKFKK